MSLSSLRSTFDGDPAEFEAAIRALRGDLSSMGADLSTAADSFGSISNPDFSAESNIGASAVVINGPISVYGVQDVESLYDQLTAEARRRNA